MGEKVLFEMRVRADEDGTHVEINASPEWRARHRARRRPGPHGVFAWAGCCGADDDPAPRRESPMADDLRRALDSLQRVYDDLYGGSPAMRT